MNVAGKGTQTGAPHEKVTVYYLLWGGGESTLWIWWPVLWIDLPPGFI